MLSTFSISEYSSAKLTILQISLKKVKKLIQSYKMVAEQDQHWKPHRQFRRLWVACRATPLYHHHLSVWPRLSLHNRNQNLLQLWFSTTSKSALRHPNILFMMPLAKTLTWYVCYSWKRIPKPPWLNKLTKIVLSKLAFSDVNCLI